MSSTGSSESGDYDFRGDEDDDKRYPLHDCCEFEDVEALKVGGICSISCPVRGCEELPQIFFLSFILTH